MGKKNQTRILFLTDVFVGMGGSERNIVNLLRGLDRRRFQIIVACFISGAISHTMKNEGYDIEILPNKKPRSWACLYNLFYLMRLIKKRNISLIVTYHESSDIYGLTLSKMLGIPIIGNRRDMGFNARWKHRLFYKLLGRQFDFNIAVSNSVKEAIIRKGWFREDKIRVIHNGVDTGIFIHSADKTEAKNKLSIDKHDLVVGIVSNLRKIKGIHFFINAASIIHCRIKNVKFVVIGEDLGELGFARRDLEQLAAGLNVLDHIIFLGKREDVHELLQIVDLGVLPSMSEGFSNVILEFMACGKPVVATNVGGNREAVATGENGFLVAPENSTELAYAILRILENAEMRKRFGVNARAQVEKYFRLDGMIKIYQETFLNVISKYECWKRPCS